MMKAVVITQYGEPCVLKLTEKPLPKYNINDVLIKVYAAGVNRPDVMQRQGKYPAPEGIVSDIPGLEVSGEIVACGSAVNKWKPGDKVCALIPGGGYAEYAVAYQGCCLPIPKDLNFVEAASLPETVFTVWYNVFMKGNLKSGETLFVHGGSSGIGITAIQLAKAFNTKVYVTAGSDEKCTACLNLGADKAINYRKADFEEILKKEKVDVILDMIGGEYTNKNINILSEEGRLVLINAMNGISSTVNLLNVIRKRLTITGSTLRARPNSFKEYLCTEIHKNAWRIIENGSFKPVIYQTFKMKEAYLAHKLMESSMHIGKIVLTNT